MTFRRYHPALASAALSLLLGAAGQAFAQAPAGQAPAARRR